MESVEQTKLRILREAIQSNVGGTRVVSATKPQEQPKAIFPVWLWGFLLIASIVYLAVPALVVSRGKEFVIQPGRHGHSGREPSAQSGDASSGPFPNKPVGPSSLGQENRNRPGTWR